MSFLTNNYERATASSQYLKLPPNESVTIRIISKPVEGYQTFIDNKPLRWALDADMPKAAYKSEDKVRPFAAFNVYHIEEGGFKIFSCTARSILLEIANLAKVDGDPMTYNLKITRKGAGLDTKYYVRLDSKKELNLEVVEQAQKFNKSVDLMQLFVDGGNPFSPKRS